jgi:hypothetical protein
MQQPAAQAPQTDAFAQAPPTGGEAAQSALPNMIGDLGTYGVAPRVQSSNTFASQNQPLTFAQLNQLSLLNASINTSPSFSSFSTFSSSSSSSSQSSTSASFLQSKVPVVSFGAFKISDNESVQPVDRVFLTYNYFDVDGFHGNSSSINREVIGFEKTFVDGRASFGMRVPFSQVGEGLGGSSDVDGLSFIGKYAFWMNNETGSLISGGLVVTVPTGPDVLLAPGSTINTTLLQPYLGYAFNFGRFYLQGFSEIIVPTDNTFSTFIANDIGIGYRLESIPVTPTFEVHANDALNHQGSGGTPLGFIDTVAITGGVHTLIGNSILTLGVSTPVTGPKLYGVEAIAQFNWRF